MAIHFQHPINGYVVAAYGLSSPIWCLLFCPIYLAIKGLWGHAVLALFTTPFSWIVYPFFVRKLLRQHYLKSGWTQIPPPRPQLDLALSVIGGLILFSFVAFTIGVFNRTPRSNETVPTLHDTARIHQDVGGRWGFTTVSVPEKDAARSVRPRQ